MSKWAVRSTKVDEIRNYILASITGKIRSWNLTQKAIAERLGMDRVRVNRMMTNKIEAISLEALISVAEISGLDVSIGVADLSLKSKQPIADCLRCRHQTLDAEKDQEILDMKRYIMQLETKINAASTALKDAKFRIINNE